MSDCIVCRGGKQIRVPIYKPAVPYNQDALGASISIDESFRVYPCPECAMIGSVERVRTIEHSVRCYADPELMSDARYLRSRREHVATGLADAMLRQNLIWFRTRKDTSEVYGRPSIEITGSIAALSLADRRKLQDVIEEHQDAIASEVVIEAAKQIDNWRSDYGAPDLSKREAKGFVVEALNTVLNRQKQKRVA